MRTTMLLLALAMSAGGAAAAEQGIGGYRATVMPDNRVKYTLSAPEFTFTRITSADGRETEIAIGGPHETDVTIRFGGGEIQVERAGQVVSIRHGDGDKELLAAASLLTGRAVSAFRRAVGAYERDLLNGAAVSGASAPFAYSLLLTAAFVSQLAGDPNAVERTRDLIRRLLAAKVRGVAWQQRDCVTDYEKALLANDQRNSQCLESADNLDSLLMRAAERTLCAAEFLAGALSAEAQFVECSALKITG
jgi:hypothetical protein